MITAELQDRVIGPFKSRTRADNVAEAWVERGAVGVRVRPILSGYDLEWEWQYQDEAEAMDRDWASKDGGARGS